MCLPTAPTHSSSNFDFCTYSATVLTVEAVVGMIAGLGGTLMPPEHPPLNPIYVQGLSVNQEAVIIKEVPVATTATTINTPKPTAAVNPTKLPPSPLQAFITGTLPSFNLSTSTNPNHLSDHRQGALCHVPMGFQATHLRHKAANGARVYLVLKAICGTSSSPLRQLSEKLGCLTKRTPRSLGDIFGFLWHLNYQLFNKDNIVEQLKTAITRRPNSVEEFITTFISLNQVPPQPSPADSGLVKSLQTMAPVIPFLYQLFRVNTDDFLPVTLFNLAQHCHKVENSNGSFKIMHENSSNSAVTSGHNCSSYPNDLWSLCQPVVPAPTGEGMTDPQSACRNAQCGGYMVPLTHSAGATYAPVHASVYLSWLAYLTEDFYEWFQNLLDEFKKIDCNESGCGGQSKCFDEHKAGTHGTSDKCQCASVVQCGGTLPLLYRHGFQFYSPAVLMDGSNNNTKRDCKAFADQLQSVISGQSLSSLLTSIDAFLYAIRWEFFSKLSGFWTIYLTLILYTFFFLLDTLHLRSHLKLASSHTVPPLALLTTGKALPVTKLTYIVP
ncbi:extracellular matrix-binding ebh [Babesia caballi]|uniref:Extracellular matrix-binding ebh n=1 Tax=Babesia caballi TaxID=5871 RepID=A0AAV4M2Y0_BABCB|nr:extracellular matrix-binding ebh [Babesia caballi]